MPTPTISQDNERKNTGIRLQDEFYRQIKIEAATQGVSISLLVEAATAAFLRASIAEKKRILGAVNGK